MALRYAYFGYILENCRVVMEGLASDLAANEDVKEFYLGLSSGGWRQATAQLLRLRVTDELQLVG